MKELKVKNSSLGEIVTRIETNGYKHLYTLDAEKKIWQMYTKQEENITKIAYVSDFSELMTTETFKNLGGKPQEQVRVRNIMSNYQAHIDTIDSARDFNFKNNGTYIIGGMVLGAFTRHPVGILAGGLFGFVVSQIAQYSQVKEEKRNLENYLQNHSISVGGNAYKKLVVKS